MLPGEATVLVVDDDAAVRRGVARLARAAGYSVETFASPVEFLRRDLPDGPACVLLDMCMDGLTGLDVQNALTKNSRRIPVLFLSGHGTIPTAATTIKLGAQDFLEKPFQPKKLIEAIRSAIEHDKQARVSRHEREELNRRYARLTAREREVMALVVSGLLNKQAAAELGISEKTIKVHRARVMEKMQVQSLAELVRLAGHLEISVAASDAPEVEPS